MSKKLRCSLAVASGLLAAVTAAAQTPSSPPSIQLPVLDRPADYPGPPLTLNAAIEEALRNNPSVTAMRGEVDAARLRPAQSGFLAPPLLSAQIWQWPINTVNPLNTNMYMFTVEQEIPGRGKRDLRTAAAEREADAAAGEVAVASRQAVTDLKHAYVALFVARSAADLSGQSAGILRQLADASEAKYAAGRSSQQDVLKPFVELSKLYDAALMFRQQADLAAAQMNVLMGRAADGPIGPLQEMTLSADAPAPEIIVPMALERHPELQAARLAVERIRAALAMARSDEKPDYVVQGGYMLTPRGTDAWTGQVGITWPSAPWSRGRTAARIAELTASIAGAEARARAVESGLRLAIQQATVRMKTAERRAALLRTTILPQSRQAFEAARVGYEADRVDFLTLLESQRALLNEQLELVRALGDLADARADFERATGVDVGR